MFLLKHSTLGIAAGVWLAARNVLEHIADTLGACQVGGPGRSPPAALGLAGTPTPRDIVSHGARKLDSWQERLVH